MNAKLALLLPVALLAACERKGEEATVEIRSGNGSTEINAQPGKESRLTIDTPAVKADIKVPFLSAMTERMEIDGVKLYPGSKIAGVNINANEDKEDGRFTLRFQAPAAREKVADWFRQQFAENGFKMTLQGSRFTGTNDEGNPVTLDLSDGPNGTAGEIRIAER